MPFSRIPCAAVGAWYRGKLFGVYFAVARCGSELSGVGQWLMVFGALQWTGLDWIIWKQEALHNVPSSPNRRIERDRHSINFLQPPLSNSEQQHHAT